MMKKAALEEVTAENAVCINNLERSISEHENNTLIAADTIRNLQNVFFALQESHVSVVTSYLLYITMESNFYGFSSS
jgi:hypothetical protein